MESHRSQLIYHYSPPKVNNATEGPSQKKMKAKFLRLIDVGLNRSCGQEECSSRENRQQNNRTSDNPWECVTSEVNLVDRVPRTVAETRRKFTDLRADVKKEVQEK